MASAEPCGCEPRATLALHPRLLSRFWGTGLLSTDETLGFLLAYLSAVQPEPAPAPDHQLNTQHSTLKTPAAALGALLRQVGDTLDALTGGELDLWRAEGLWFWRWTDTGQLCPRGLASQGEALVDALEQRYPAAFLPEEMRLEA
ncbi:MAG: hypothetical protein OHK0022_29800 [Roseiflexaceae bacterium]